MRVRDSFALVLALLFGAAGCPSHPTGKSLLAQYQKFAAVSPKLYKQLETWGALPEWHRRAFDMHDDWLKSLHENVTAEGWPSDVADAAAGLTETGKNMGATKLLGSARAIVIPVATSAFLSRLFEVVNYPRGSEEATRKLALVIGMLSETNYLDSSGEEGAEVVMGTRFIYYHELGHVIRNREAAPKRPDWLLDAEEDLVEELVADQLAFAMLMVELRRHRDLQPYAFAGIATALGMVAVKEFAESDKGDGRRSIRGAVLRMSRILHWARIAQANGDVTAEAVSLGRFYWKQVLALLRSIDTVPSPVASLLAQASESESRWAETRNMLALWCVFGDRAKVLNAVRRVRDHARKQTNDPSAVKLLKLIEFLRSEFAPIDNEIGVNAALGRSRANSCTETRVSALIGHSAGRQTAVAVAWGVLPVGLYQEQPQLDWSPSGCSVVGGKPKRNMVTSATSAADGTSSMQLNVGSNTARCTKTFSRASS